ncbi:MAG: hypothetical protein WCF23_18815 [Candidatus Nitrosopolaris sp.]
MSGDVYITVWLNGETRKFGLDRYAFANFCHRSIPCSPLAAEVDIIQGWMMMLLDEYMELTKAMV